jgi:hypothetical protein
MRRFRPTDYVRMILATAVLFGSVGSTPTVGHAHDNPNADDHDHLDWATHDHSHSHLDAISGTEQHALVESDNAVFHIHGMWFGIPFSMPAPTEPKQTRPTEHPLALACLTPTVTVIAGHSGSVWQRIVCSDFVGLVPDLYARLEPPINSLHGMPSCGSSRGHCALEARSGVLRC